MKNEVFDEAVTKILREDATYPRSAYNLLPAALDYTVRHVHQKRREQGGEDRPEHVTGKQLAEGFREYMISTYGPFAKDILDDLQIKRTRDIGELVYNLIRVGAFGRTEKDRIEDFDNVYDFEDAFVKPYLPKNGK